MEIQHPNDVDSAIAAYAAEHAGTEFDLDEDLEAAGIELFTSLCAGTIHWVAPNSPNGTVSPLP